MNAPQTATQVLDARAPFDLAAGKLELRIQHARTLLDDIDRLAAARTTSAVTPDRSEAALRAINYASERLHVALVQFHLVQSRLNNY